MTHAESIKAIDEMCNSLGLTDVERWVSGEIAISLIRVAGSETLSAVASGILDKPRHANIERAALAIALKALMDAKDIVESGNQFRGI